MTVSTIFETKTKALIDDLKSVCANYGLGNDGNEFKIITQVFLYKFLNDKFIHEVKLVDDRIANADNWEEALSSLSEEDFEMLTYQLNENTAILKPHQFISSLYQKQDHDNFAELFDNTLAEIANNNNSLFSVVTNGGEKIILFERLSKYVTDEKNSFCRAIVNKLVTFSFEQVFNEKFDFFAAIFEYLIKDYNINSGGKYAEYFTPHAVAKIMAKCLVSEKVSNVSCYDPSAGSGTLLMNLAHQIGEDRCSIYSQDISQKSSNLLRLNLVLNNLVHSIPNIVKGNTILNPFHKDKKDVLKKFDYIVSNPPFKLDFSDYRNELDSKENKDRFFAGIPNIPPKKKESMAIYTLFLQHIIFSLSEKGKAAIVVPTGFITAKSIDKKIRKYLVDERMVSGVVSMPGDIFATTGTSVTILFLDKNSNDNVILIDASKLGEVVKDGGNQRTILTTKEENQIINSFINREEIENFSVAVSFEEIANKNYSFSAGQYFDVKIEYSDISNEEFQKTLNSYSLNLEELAEKSNKIDVQYKNALENLIFDEI